MQKLLIFTDTYKEQVNGVKRCLENIEAHLPKHTELVIISTDDFVSVPFLGYKEIRLSLAFPRQIRKKIEEIKPDMIHIMTEGPIGLTAAFVCQKVSLPYTTSFHTKFPEYLALRNPLLKEEYVHKYLQYIHDGAESILVSNTGVVEYLEKNGYEKMCIVPFGIDHMIFHPGEKTYFQEEEKPILLYVGRIAIEKNIEAFLAIDPHYTKVVVGDGPLLEKYKKEYREIHFLGRKSGEELGDIYRSADVFISPAKTDTLGLVNLEAMACGLPVIAYDLENTRAVIEDGKTGILISEGGDLTEGIDKALALNPENMIAYARGFTWTAYTKAFLSFQVSISPTLWT